MTRILMQIDGRSKGDKVYLERPDAGYGKVRPGFYYNPFVDVTERAAHTILSRPTLIAGQ